MPKPYASTKESVLTFVVGLGLLIALGIILALAPAHNHSTGLVPQKYPLLEMLITNSHVMSDWLFLQVHAAGGNPYDQVQLSSFNGLVGVDSFYSAARFSPPWYYLLFAPFGHLPPAAFVALAFVISAVVAIRVCELSFVYAGLNSPSLLLLTGPIILFPPLVEDVRAGQISVLLTLVVLHALLALKEGRELMVGFWLALLSIKPQSTYLLVLAILLVALRDRRAKVLSGYLVTLVVMLAATYVAAPDLFDSWWAVPVPETFKTLTISTVIREFLLFTTQILYFWPIGLIAGLSAVGIGWLIVSRKIGDGEVLLVVLGASVLTAPYGWFYDSTVLIPLHIYLLVRALEQLRIGKSWALISLISLAVLTYLILILPEIDYLIMLYYPAVLTIMTWRSLRGSGARVLS